MRWPQFEQHPKAHAPYLGNHWRLLTITALRLSTQVLKMCTKRVAFDLLTEVAR